MKFNPTIATDAYKITHWLQRPEGISKFMSYGEPRKGGQHNEVCFFGLQYVIKEYFMTVVTNEDIQEGFEDSLSCFGFEHYFPKHIWEKVRDLGHYPIRIKAVKEGTVVPTGNVFYTIESTEDWFADMVSHFEDWLMWLWYSCAVATRMFNIHKGIRPAYEKSSDNPFYGFSVNDFGLRGATFYEGACVGGAAALIFSEGTDNMPARKFIRDYYNTPGIGQSVWATEHSVATVWGPGVGEYLYIKAQLTRSDPNAPVSIVIDSYDADNFIKVVVADKEIRQMIIDRPGRTIMRPDSGDPLTNICKYSDMLGDIFGYSLNHKNHRVLNHNVGIIQGDGMDENSIPYNFGEYVKTNWSADNVVTGSGGGLLEIDLSRDTDRWAVKVCHVEREVLAEEDMTSQGGPGIGEKHTISVDVSKTPKSDMTKASKKGKLKLHQVNGNFMTFESSNTPGFEAYTDVLELVYENGVLHRDMDWKEIRDIAKSYL